ncbi:MAG: hypothetical protein OXB98_09445 [Bryobacterales bacterium]|nr:hypothetical protein [Bryobacterales bacterium]
MSASLLAHLIPRIAAKAEPAATEALAYVLRASLDVAREFVNIVGLTGINPFTPGHIGTEEQHGDSKPDLTIYDTDGAVRVFVENKFWAGLTDAQPVTYLEKLPDNTTSILLFVVPHQRIFSVWSELKKRCGHRKIDLSGGETTKDITWARAGKRTIAITSWNYVLKRLRQAANAVGNETLEQDIVQFRGLTDQMNTAEFLPLQGDEVTDVNVARRLINYSDLIEEITERLKAKGIADTKRLLPTHGWYTAGRYLRVHAKFGLWMGVHLQAWRDYGITPVWLEVYPSSSFSGVSGKPLQKIKNMVEDVQESDNGSLRIPILLATGVERDKLIEDAVNQVRSIADRFLQAFPAE